MSYYFRSLVRGADGAARERALAKPELACGADGAARERALAKPELAYGVDGAARERALAKPELLIRNANLSPHAFNLVAGHKMPDGGFAAWREGVAAYIGGFGATRCEGAARRGIQ